MTTYKYVRRLDGFRGHACLYKLSSPVEYDFYKSVLPDNNASNDEVELVTKSTDHVIVSTSTYFGLETFIFPADANGTVLNWGELPGSQRGTSSHVDVLTALLDHMEKNDG